MKRRVLMICVLCPLILAISGSPASSQNADVPQNQTDSIRSFIAQHSETGTDPKAEVAVRKVDLGGPNTDAYVAYIHGGGWCGSGGCNTLIGARRGEVYRVLASVPATELPIVLLPGFHKGSRDVGVTVKGALNGDHFDPPSRVVLSFSGVRYAFHKPKAEIANPAAGEVLIADDAKFLPLY
jgi:hypothetical protein